MRYLEAACTCNLKKLSFIMQQIRTYAKKADLKPSVCYYKRWGVKKKHGQKPVIPLRFNKSGNQEIEKAYATYYVDSGRIEQLKKRNWNKQYLLVKRIYLTKQGIKPGSRGFVIVADHKTQPQGHF